MRVLSLYIYWHRTVFHVRQSATTLSPSMVYLLLRTSCFLNVWEFGSSEVWKLEVLEVWYFGRLGLGGLGVWKFGALGGFGSLDV